MRTTTFVSQSSNGVHWQNRNTFTTQTNITDINTICCTTNINNYNQSFNLHQKIANWQNIITQRQLLSLVLLVILSTMNLLLLVVMLVMVLVFHTSSRIGSIYSNITSTIGNSKWFSPVKPPFVKHEHWSLDVSLPTCTTISISPFGSRIDGIPRILSSSWFSQMLSFFF